MLSETFGFLLLVSLCGQSLPSPVRQGVSSLGDSVQDLSVKILSTLSTKQSGNVFFSPLSLHIVLTQLYLATAKNSPCNHDLAVLLGLTPTKVEEFIKVYNSTLNSLGLVKANKLDVASRLFISKDFNVRPSYRSLMQSAFKTDVESLDFADSKKSASLINGFVKEKTHGKIDGLLTEEDLDGLTKLVIANAVYFKGKWETKFQVSGTAKMKFHVDKSNVVEVTPMTLRKKMPVVNVEKLKSQVFEIDYQNKDFTMMVILPHVGVDIKEVEAKLGNANITALRGQLLATPEFNVDLAMPKFEVNMEMDLKEALKSLGASTIFDEGKCDLSELADQKVKVSKAVHKATIRVNEDGSEASASTSIVLNLRVGLEEMTLNVDRPFLFVVTFSQRHMPIFMGKIVNPRS